MTATKHVRVCEVGLRDGLQNQPDLVGTDDKRRLLDALINAGVTDFEVASFVSPKAVPQMADAEELVRRLPNMSGLSFMALVPNLRGYERARGAGVRKVAVVLACTETLNERNIRMSLKAATDTCERVIEQARADDIEVRAYVSAALGCPYEGEVPHERVLTLTERMLQAGAAEVAIADTIGAGNPADTKRLFQDLVRRFGADVLTAHFHDTRALGLTLAWVALEAGVRSFDSSIGGLGGCPFAPGASGNLATEDLVFMLHSAGFETGISVAGLLGAVGVAGEATGRPAGGRILPWLRTRRDGAVA